MKALLSCLILLTLHAAKAQTFNVNLSKSSVKWTGYAEVGNYAPSGTVKIKTASLQFKNGILIGGNINMNMATLSQANQDLTSHLKKEDFFDVDKFPEASFTITAVNRNSITGKMTIKGITKQVSFIFEQVKTNGTIVLKAKIKVDRTIFGIKYNSKSYFQDVGNYAIKNEFDLDIELSVDQ